MAESKPRGRFVWFDLVTSDPRATLEFYPAVTGWSTTQWDGGTPYTMWTANGASLGGVMQLPPRPANAPAPSAVKGPTLSAAEGPHWLAYISSPDLDETVRLADSLGARVIMPPSNVPSVGRFAVLTDPQGARFAAFTPESEAPGHEGDPQLGEFSWHELATHDYPAAFRFYERLFGWEKSTAMDMGGGAIYQMFNRNGLMLGGMFNRTPDLPGLPSWLHYIRVEDLDRALAAVTDRGGAIVSGPMEVPGGSKVAQCLDPQGASFALHQRRE
jgi:predicted enzyme related to lactoylglutathione lyase